MDEMSKNALLIAITNIVIEILKKWIKKEWLPIASNVVALCLAAGYLSVLGQANFLDIIRLGLVSGLSASGVHEVIDTTIKRKV